MAAVTVPSPPEHYLVHPASVQGVPTGRSRSRRRHVLPHRLGPAERAVVESYRSNNARILVVVFQFRIVIRLYTGLPMILLSRLCVALLVRREK